MPRLVAIPQWVRADATALLVFEGEPDTFVEWSISGPGTLDILSQWTDGAGLACARYTPGSPGDTPTVTATFGGA